MSNMYINNHRFDLYLCKLKFLLLLSAAISLVAKYYSTSLLLNSISVQILKSESTKTEYCFLYL